MWKKKKMYILVLNTDPWFILNHESCKVYDLSCSQSVGGAQDGLASLHRYFTSSLWHKHVTISHFTFSSKASRLKPRPATSGSKALCLITWLADTHTYTQKHIVIISHRAKVMSLISARNERSKKLSIKVRANIWESHLDYNEAFQAIGVTDFISRRHGLNRNDTWISSQDI